MCLVESLESLESLRCHSISKFFDTLFKYVESKSCLDRSLHRQSILTTFSLLFFFFFFFFLFNGNKGTR
jgi:hypothetical protein